MMGFRFGEQSRYGGGPRGGFGGGRQGLNATKIGLVTNPDNGDAARDEDELGYDQYA